ncbi:uncharacterized protein LOC126908524 [Daktulosphaira vitifoliae]|uniref:uncharacterized protein LOC126908524 n=1 Tax=Daktulosphaira vitifoliae TaxID=58002 RepID=UPI0021AACCAD|nr:uncharacterized protein LOC126908524 [Daktulosphaira vitifoliae]
MIVIKLILLLHIYLIFGLSVNDLQCNFSKYILNYFNHNNRYLIEMIENIQKYDVVSLNKYGNAIKTHGEIVLIMLDVLRDADKNFYSTDLISVNLYLNNVSDYVNFYAKNDDGIFDLSDKTTSIIKGYEILHKFFSDYLNMVLSKKCQCVTFDEVFIYFPDYNESGEYTLENFLSVANKLKNRLLQTNKLQNNTDENIKNLEHSKVYFVFNKAIKRCKYWEFLPKNLLFYEFMMSNPKISEKDIMRNSQDKQYPVLVNGKIKSVLDLIRFAPLSITCPDGSNLTLFDIFRYIKYSFHAKEIQAFHGLIMTATFRPIAFLVRNFIIILRSSKYVYNFSSDQEERLIFYNDIISVGKNVIEIFQNFVNLNLFGDGPANVFLTFLKTTTECFDSFLKKKKKKNFNLSSLNLMYSLKSFLYDNKYDFDNITWYFTKDIINSSLNKLIVNVKHAEKFIRKLKEHQKFFELSKNTLNIPHKLNVQYTYVFKEYTINELCRSKDIYTLFYKFNDDYINQIFDYEKKSKSDDGENRNKNISQENYPEDNINNDCYCNIIYYPKYLKDYILFI